MKLSRVGISVRLEDVTHEYGRSEESAGVRALDSVSVAIEAGDFAIVTGPSGSGKSTLLNLIGAVDRPTRGRVFLGDSETSTMSESGLTLLRRKSIGFIFQFFNLIPTLTVRENVAFPLALAGVARGEAASKAMSILERVGLTERAKHFPNELSGGEMQRVAIARAIVHEPPLLLADEPTGNLDTQTGHTVLELIRSVHDLYRPTIVMATHSTEAARIGHFVLHVVDGRVAKTEIEE